MDIEYRYKQGQTKVKNFKERLNTYHIYMTMVNSSCIRNHAGSKMSYLYCVKISRRICMFSIFSIDNLIISMSFLLLLTSENCYILVISINLFY